MPVFSRKRQAGLLLHRQRIHVAAQQNGFAPAWVTNQTGDACLPNILWGQPHFG
ncbi:hypothetical protein SDC9_147883 [bioreactor metagenome]|uniref:Uncharacterized protein n=1 Tax=bioreactor metagenome TaxID=1076179 RepID=A0A645EG16_9ZZZZ